MEGVLAIIFIVIVALIILSVIGYFSGKDMDI